MDYSGGFVDFIKEMKQKRKDTNFFPKLISFDGQMPYLCCQMPEEFG